MRAWAGVLAPVMLILLLAGCGINRYLVAPYEKISLRAAPDINPDASGRPSPVTLKLLELGSRTTFDNLDFDGAFGNGETLLADDLLSLRMLSIQPGQTMEQRIDLHRDAAFIAIIVAYRDIDQAQWRLVYPIAGNWYSRHVVRLEALGIALGIAQDEDR